MYKLHLPNERKNFSEEELSFIANEMCELRMKVRQLELDNKVPLKEMIDFDRLLVCFFKTEKYKYGKRLEIRKS